MRIAVVTCVLLLSGCYQPVVEVLETTSGTASVSAGTGATTGAAGTTGHTTGSTTGTTAGASTTGGSPTSTTGASSGTTTTTGTASSSTSGGPTCPLSDCAPGQVEVRGTLTSLCPGGSTVTTGGTLNNQLDPSQVATTDSSGDFYFCLAPGSQLAASADIPSYIPSIFATMNVQQSACLGQVPLICASAEELIGFELPGFDSSLAALIVAVTPESATGTCSNLAGWSFAITDGFSQGLDAGVAAVSASGVTATDVTGATGLLLYYNIPPSAGPITAVLGAQPSFALADGGTECPFVGDQPPAQLTGGVALSGGVVSYFPYVVP